MIGLCVAGAILLAGRLTGGSVNPARTFGPDVALSFFDGSVVWSQGWEYWVGPVLGALGAAGLDEFLTQTRRAAASRGRAT